MSTIFCGPRNGREPVNPQDFTGLSIWLESTWGIALGGGSDVVAWQDQSSHSLSYNQLNPANRPTLGGAILNGRAPIVFDAASSQYMDGGLSIADCFDATKNHGTIAVVIQTNSGVFDNCILGADSAAVFTSWVGIFLTYIDGNIYWDAGNATNGPAGARFFPTLLGGPDAATPSIYFFVRDGATSLIYKNGTLLGSVAVGSTYASGLPTILLGGSTNGGVPGQFADMSLWEWCVWKSALSANQITILSRTWGSKYGITVA